jgi:hypothetical protein
MIFSDKYHPRNDCLFSHYTLLLTGNSFVFHVASIPSLHHLQVAHSLTIFFSLVVLLHWYSFGITQNLLSKGIFLFGY